MKVKWLVMLATLTFSTAALANKDPVPQSTAPHATVIGSDEIEAAVTNHGTGALSDSVLRVVSGPSTGGQAIVGGTRHRVGPGDIVIIPAGTPHGFLEVTTPRIIYTIIRIDPLRVLAIRSKAH